MLLRDIPAVKDALASLNQDSLFSKFKIDPDTIPWAMFPKGYAGLVRIILGQQVSTIAADAMWARVVEHAGGIQNITPEWMAQRSDEEMKAMAFSRQKTRYARKLAQDIIDSSFNTKALDSLSDDEACKSITKLLGFGPWSAHIYLLFCLGRSDILPAKDLAVDRALQYIFELSKPPAYEHALNLVEPWNGKRSAVTLLLWQVYIDQKL